MALLSALHAASASSFSSAAAAAAAAAGVSLWGLCAALRLDQKSSNIQSLRSVHHHETS